MCKAKRSPVTIDFFPLSFCPSLSFPLFLTPSPSHSLSLTHTHTETDGSAHRPVGRTSSDDREVKGVREKLGETGSSEQRELEDTLKAADQGKRALSSPPGIGCEEEERDTIHPLSSTAEEKEPSSKTATVQLRPKKVPASQSMDKIANKVYTCTCTYVHMNDLFVEVYTHVHVRMHAYTLLTILHLV